MEYLSDSPLSTSVLAREIASSLVGGEVILLNGNLGAGKTTFTKALAAALGVSDVVTSPTFTIVKEYEGRLRLFHIDMYRLTDADELYEIGIDELFADDAVVVIEWNKMPDLKGRKIINITIEILGKNARHFTVTEA